MESTDGGNSEVARQLDSRRDGQSPALKWYESLVNELPLAVFAKDTEGRYVMVNDRFVEVQSLLKPMTKDEIVGSKVSDMRSASEAERHERDDLSALSGVKSRTEHEPFTHPDGRIEIFASTKMPMHDADGSIVGLIGFASEIAEPVRVAQALADSERRYRMALQASRDGIWELDVESSKVVISATCAQLLHLPATSEPLPISSLFTYRRPEEAQRVQQAVDALVADPREMMSLRCDVVLNDGHSRTVQLEAAALTENGATSRIIGAIADVTDAMENERRLEHLANHDPLTALDNRRSLTAEIDYMIAAGESGALLYLDLDDFKLVNDSLGHSAGDDMLVAVAERLDRATRANDVVARLGGDEFAVLLKYGASTEEEAAERTRVITGSIIDLFSQPFAVGGVETYTSASIGALTLDGYSNSGDLLRDADTAMYSAKREQSTVRFFEPDMHRAAASLRQLHSDLRRASEAHEFHLEYQPIVDADDHSVVALEALLRWTPPGVSTALSPAHFLPTLESTGLIVEVGAWIIEEACRQLASWRAVDGLRDTRVSINLSRAQLRQNDLTPWIRECLERFGLDGTDIIFEVTETAIAADGGQLRLALEGIRTLGAAVAIDDFGVGQSCLSQLHDIPIDQIKIDMSFVRRIADVSAHDDPVLQAILGLGSALDKRTVAEGVETADQAAWLALQGCGRLQGYFFDRPLTPESVADRIVDGRLVPSGLQRSCQDAS